MSANQKFSSEKPPRFEFPCGKFLNLAGYGFFSDYKFDAVLNRNTNYQGGYGGFYFEPILLPKFPAHITLPVLIGVGGIAYVSDINLNDNLHFRFVSYV